MSDYYVAPTPTGSPAGDGSIGDPWNLQTALTHPIIQPGDTIWLREGRYTGKFVPTIAGINGNQVVVRSYPDEWAVIDSGVAPITRANIFQQDTGGFITYRDFEVMSSDPVRNAPVGPYPSEIKRGEGFSFRAPGIKLINLVIHDCAQGISAWQEALDAEIYGCIIYHNGWIAPDRGHGHGIYSQNLTGTKLFRHNIIFNGCANGIQLFGSEGPIKNYALQANAIFNAGMLSALPDADNLIITGGGGPENINITDNFSYSNSFEGQWVIGGDGAKDLVMTGNYVAHRARVRFWEDVTLTDNTFMGVTIMRLSDVQSAFPRAHTWDENEYFYVGGPWSPFELWLKQPDTSTVITAKTFANWKTATGYDASSNFTTGMPTGVRTTILPNEYQPGRYTIVVYNWAEAENISLNLGSIMSAGQTYRIRNAQGYLTGAEITGEYAGTPVSIPASGWTVEPPIGLPTPDESGPIFNVFILVVEGEAELPPVEPPPEGDPEPDPEPEPPEPEPEPEIDPEPEPDPEPPPPDSDPVALTPEPEPEPPASRPCEPLARLAPFYTNKPLALSNGVIAEDHTQPAADEDSFCSRFGNLSINDLCRCCENAQLFVFAHAEDWCLKQMGPEVYVREMTNEASFDVPAGIWADEGYPDKLVIGPIFLDLPDEEKNMRKLELEFDAIPQLDPAQMNVRIGYAANAFDPNLDSTSRCGVVWKTLEPKDLKCPTPNKPLRWDFWFTGRMLYVELSTTGIGGGYNISRIGMEIRALPRSTTS